MSKKYTVIYTKRWMVGCHVQALTCMERVEVECDDSNRMKVLADAVQCEDIQYIFEGWPLQVGETEEDLKVDE